MAFGKQSKGGRHASDSSGSAARSGEELVNAYVSDDAADDAGEGPFDIEDFDSADVAAIGRLDLGAVLIPTPPNEQVQVEVNEAGMPGTVWVITPNGRYTIAAYAAPKSAGLWREVAGELAESLRKDTPNVSIESGPWGREVVGVAGGAVRFIGVDGYRWMVRCVANGTPESIAALTIEARNALADTVVRRGETPLPVRTPLPIQLPEVMIQQLQAAAQQAARQAAEQMAAQMAQLQELQRAQAAGDTPMPPAEPVARRSAEGSAMQQLRSTITGG